MRRKFVVAMMMHETNTFSPLPTPIESFARRGEIRGPGAIAAAEGTNTPLGGFLDIVRHVRRRRLHRLRPRPVRLPEHPPPPLSLRQGHGART